MSPPDGTLVDILRGTLPGFTSEPLAPTAGVHMEHMALGPRTGRLSGGADHSCLPKAPRGHSCPLVRVLVFGGADHSCLPRCAAHRVGAAAKRDVPPSLPHSVLSPQHFATRRTRRMGPHTHTLQPSQMQAFVIPSYRADRATGPPASHGPSHPRRIRRHKPVQTQPPPRAALACPRRAPARRDPARAGAFRSPICRIDPPCLRRRVERDVAPCFRPFAPSCLRPFVPIPARRPTRLPTLGTSGGSQIEKFRRFR